MKYKLLLNSGFDIYKTILTYQCAMDTYLQEKLSDGRWYERFTADNEWKLDEEFINDSSLDSDIKFIITAYVESFSFTRAQVEGAIRDLALNKTFNITDINNTDKVLLSLVLLSCKKLNVKLSEGISFMKPILQQVEQKYLRILKTNSLKELWRIEHELSEYKHKFKFAFMNKLKDYRVKLDTASIDIWADRARKDYLNYRLLHNDPHKNYWYKDTFEGEASSIGLLISAFQNFYFSDWLVKNSKEINSTNLNIEGDDGLVTTDNSGGIEHEELSKEVIDFPRVVRNMIIATRHLYKMQNTTTEREELMSCFKTVYTRYKELEFGRITKSLNSRSAIKSLNNRSDLFSYTVRTCNENHMRGKQRYNRANELIDDLINPMNMDATYLNKRFIKFKSEIGRGDSDSGRDDSTCILTEKYTKAYIDKNFGEKITSKAYDKYFEVLSKDGKEKAMAVKEKYISDMRNIHTEKFYERYFLEIYRGVLAVTDLVSQLRMWGINPLSFPSTPKDLEDMSKFKTLKDYLRYAETLDLIRQVEINENKEKTDNPAFVAQQKSLTILIEKFDNAYTKFIQDLEGINNTKDTLTENQTLLKVLQSSRKINLDDVINNSNETEVENYEKGLSNVVTILKCVKNHTNIVKLFGTKDKELIELNSDYTFDKLGRLFRGNDSSYIKNHILNTGSLGKGVHYKITTNEEYIELLKSLFRYNEVFNLMHKENITAKEYVACVKTIYEWTQLFFLSRYDKAQDVFLGYVSYHNALVKLSALSQGKKVPITLMDLYHFYLNNTNAEAYRLLEFIERPVFNFSNMTQKRRVEILTNPDERDLESLTKTNYLINLHENFETKVLKPLIINMASMIGRINTNAFPLGLRLYSYQLRTHTLSEYVNYISNRISDLERTAGFNIVKDLKYLAKYNEVDRLISRMGIINRYYTTLCNYFNTHGGLDLKNEYKTGDVTEIAELNLKCSHALQYFVKELPMLYVSNTNNMSYEQISRDRLFTNYVIFQYLAKLNNKLLPDLNNLKMSLTRMKSKVNKQYKPLDKVMVRSLSLNNMLSLLEELPDLIREYSNEHQNDIIDLNVEAITRDLTKGLAVYKECIFKTKRDWITTRCQEDDTTLIFYVLTVYGVAKVLYEKKTGVTTVKELTNDITAHVDWIEPIVKYGK